MDLGLVCILVTVTVFVGELEASYRSHHYPTVWSAWSWWSSCSRTCGEGVKRRSRTCLLWAGHKYVETALSYCEGHSMNYEFCQTLNCSHDFDFRSYQCSLHDHRHYLFGKAYFWIPTDGVNPCDLNCKAKGYRVQYNFGRALDGTLCYPGSKSVCVGGNCKTVGCDHKIESGMVLDNCGICGGDNSTCRLVTGSNHPIQQTSSDYYPVTYIPRGSTRLEIHDQTRNSLALSDSQGRRIIDGYSIGQDNLTTAGLGSTVQYSRNASIETIHVTGPTSHDALVKVRYVGDNRTISFRFYTDNLHSLPSDTRLNVTESLHHTSPVPENKEPALPYNDIPGQALSDNTVVKGKLTKVKVKRKKKKRKTKKIKVKKPKVKKPKKVKPAFCKPCKRPRDRKKQFCSSEFVSHIRVADYFRTGNETRYDVIVIKSFRNTIPLLDREYLWVPYKCRCPKLRLGQDYVVMGHTDIYKERQLRLIINYKSYVKKYSEKVDEKLTYLRDKKKCKKDKRAVT